MARDDRRIEGISTSSDIDDTEGVSIALGLAMVLIARIPGLDYVRLRKVVTWREVCVMGSQNVAVVRKEC